MNFDRRDRDHVLTEDTKAFDEKLGSSGHDLNKQDLENEKEALDSRYRERLNELEVEKREQEKIYNEKIEKLRSEDQYKEDLLQSQVVKLSEEKSKIDESYNERRDQILSDLQEKEDNIKERLHKLRLREGEKDRELELRIEEIRSHRASKVEKKMEKIRELQEEIREIEEEYDEKIKEVSNDTSYKKDILKERQDIEYEIEELKRDSDLRIQEWKQEKFDKEERQRHREQALREELTACNTQLQDKIRSLNEVKTLSLNEINDKVQVLLQEKMKCDELYNLKMDKIRQDEQFKSKEETIKEQIQQQERVYQDQIRDFEKNRFERESTFEENIRPEVVTGLIRFKDMKGYKVAKGDHDVRGWTVVGSNNEKLGKVVELVIDPEQLKVRYLDIKVDKHLIIDGEEKHLLIPIGVATLDEEDDQVLLPSLDSEMVSRLPQYSGETVTRDYERTLLTALSTDYNADLYPNERFYDHSNFDDTKFYSSRKRDRKYD